MLTDSDRPWMTALEMQFAALRLARISTERLHRQTRGDLNQEPTWAMADHNAALLLPAAIPFAWSSDTTSAVWLASKTVPNDATFSEELLPLDTASCWWWFDRPLPIPMRDREIDPRLIDRDNIAGLIITRHSAERCFSIIDARNTPHGPCMTGFNVLSIGASLSDVMGAQSLNFFKSKSGVISETSDRVRALSRFILAASVWLKQKIVVVSTGHIERHRRKQLAREFGATTSEVKVIQLRRAEVEANDATVSSESVEWSCRWIVSGHWRNQFHPSTGKHELKYILPYVKGPDDKPLKVPTHTVYQVNR